MKKTMKTYYFELHRFVKLNDLGDQDEQTLSDNIEAESLKDAFEAVKAVCGEINKVSDSPYQILRVCGQN